MDDQQAAGRVGFTRSDAAVGALAAAVLVLESALLRLLAVAQFYHFAFLVVSLALLGFGASGTLLNVAPRLRAMPLHRLLLWVGWGFATAVGAVYAVVNYLPFDSYTITWERRQLAYFFLYYLALTLPFLFGGLGIGAALAAGSGRSHRVYAANLVGSAAGALLGPALMGLAGVPGALLGSAALALTVTLRRPGRAAAGALMAVAVAGIALLAVLNVRGDAPLGVRISPYKGLSYARQYPGATTIFGAWNARARVDVVADAGTRQLPGLSYAYTGTMPAQVALAVDAGDIQPVMLTPPEEFAAAGHLPEAIAFALRPGARVLALDTGGGLGVAQALANGAGHVTAVVANPLEARAVAHAAGAAGSANVYAHPQVERVFDSPRVFAARAGEQFDLVYLPLTDAYQPVSSGAYSLGETYDLTVEAFAEALQRLAPGGILAVTRWLQLPPSEDLRLIATLLAALEAQGAAQPEQALVAYRGIQTVTALVQPGGWSPTELAQVRAFLESRRLDVVWAPGVQEGETNRFNRLPESVYYAAVRNLLASEPRSTFYRGYPFNVQPATDDRPFFFNFFRRDQTAEVVSTLGRTWQPFGGSGFLLLFALLGLTLVLSAVLIVLPLLFRRAASGQAPPRGARGLTLAYFALIGFAFLFVEIPLIQRWILLLGNATYAFTAVVAILLSFSSLGSLAARSPRLRPPLALGLLVGLAVATPFVSSRVIGATLHWPLLPRTLAAALCLAPLAVLMGLPFPYGLLWVERHAPGLAPWAWAANGFASVIASILAAILSLNYGFTAVLLLGAAAYAGAGLLLGPRLRASTLPRA